MAGDAPPLAVSPEVWEQLCLSGDSTEEEVWPAPHSPQDVGLNRASLTLLGAFILSIAGIGCCIKHKRRTFGGEPSPAAWVSCLLIFFFAGPLGPCFMWAPFAIDACYRTPNRGVIPPTRRGQNPHAGPQTVFAVAVTQPEPITAVAVPCSQPDGQPVTAVAVDNSWDSARGQPIVTGQVVTGHVVRP